MSELESINAQIDLARKELDVAMEAAIVACGAWVKSEYKLRMRRAISENSEMVCELGEEGLAPIKAQFSEVDYASIVEKAFTGEDIWLHKKDHLSSGACSPGAYFISGNRLPKPIEDGMRDSLSDIGRILVENDLDDGRSWERRNGKFRYSFGIDGGTQLKSAIRNYSILFDDLYRLLQKKEQIIAKSSSRSALDMWDSI